MVGIKVLSYEDGIIVFEYYSRYTSGETPHPDSTGCITLNLNNPQFPDPSMFAKDDPDGACYVRSLKALVASAIDWENRIFEIGAIGLHHWY